MKTIVVTRHPALVEYIHEIGLAGPDTEARVKERRVREARARRREALRKYPGATIGELLEAKHANQ